MKPTLFIGSSREAEPIATAIQAKLASVAECTPWTSGVFGLSETTLSSLTSTLHNSDFGVFVFAGDDLVESRNHLLTAPRDNVIYEAGMFAGHLAFNRCFIALPHGADIKVPTDLHGVNLGYYERRYDGNLQAAVNVFSSDVASRIKKLGPWHCPDHDRFFKLMTQFECADWIENVDKRVSTKTLIADDMVAFCKANRVNKRQLGSRHESGAYVALASAIIAQPENGDHVVLMEIRPRLVAAGVAQHRIVGAVDALHRSGKINTEELRNLRGWLEGFPDQESTFTKRVAGLR